MKRTVTGLWYIREIGGGAQVCEKRGVFVLQALRGTYRSVAKSLTTEQRDLLAQEITNACRGGISVDAVSREVQAAGLQLEPVRPGLEWSKLFE